MSASNEYIKEYLNEIMINNNKVVEKQMIKSYG